MSRASLVLLLSPERYSESVSLWCSQRAAPFQTPVRSPLGALVQAVPLYLT